MSTRPLLAALVVAVLATPALAVKVSTERFQSAAPFAQGGSLLIDNPIGAVVVTGMQRPGLRWEAIKTVQAIDDRSLHEGRAQTGLAISGNERTRVLRTTIPYPLRNGRWESKVAYRVEIPADANLTIVTVSGELIRVTGFEGGSITIKNVNGRIQLESVVAPVSVETVNGHIEAALPGRPRNDWSLSSVNGTIELRVPRNAAFEWNAETIRGGIHTSLKLAGFFRRNPELRQYWAAVGEGSKVIVRTTSVLGDIYLMGEGTALADAQPIFASENRLAEAAAAPRQPQPLRPDTSAAFRRVANTMLIQAPSSRSFVAQQARIAGDFRIDTPMGSVFVGEIGGDADITTKAGEIVLGRVGGRGDIRSLGGSLHLGEVAGPLRAHTEVGDVFIRSARKGGSAVTEGGTIHVGFTGGATSLRSGGGDVVVHRSGGPLEARTSSGDVWIAVDPGAKTQRIEAITEDGNVILQVPAGFGGEIDAIVLTSSEGAGAIASDLSGLTIVREADGGRTRIRATGKVNGGGDRIVLRASEGTIQIRLTPTLSSR
ncbi:MAG TPA: DUF4097 family beta strand repeat-containing protein [Thermoanaerobaculia bacterium]|nr:DUF4097 family beta strand repeat-containing protein [Thermoanaerobaculia bacterium]